MKKFKCSTIKGTTTQLLIKVFAIVILATTLVIFFTLNGYDVNFFLFFAVIGISTLLLVFIPMLKYSAAFVEITDKELRFLDESNTVKFTIPIVDIESAKPEPYPNNIYGDSDLNTKLTVKTKSGQIFSIFLPEEGTKYIGELVGKTVFDESKLKKIPLYMHIIFAFAVILVPLFITKAIVDPDSLDTGDYVKFFIYIPILIGFMIYYIQLRKRTKQK